MLCVCYEGCPGYPKCPGWVPDCFGHSKTNKYAKYFKLNPDPDPVPYPDNEFHLQLKVTPKSVLLTGRIVNFRAVGVGRADIKYKWQFAPSRFASESMWDSNPHWIDDNEIFQTSQTSELIISHPTWKDVGAYRCIITAKQSGEMIITPPAELMNIVPPAHELPEDEDGWDRKKNWKIFASHNRSQDPTNITIAVGVDNWLYLYEFNTKEGHYVH